MKKIKRLRLDEGLTQFEVADQVDLNQSVISALERGFKNEHKSGFKRLCNFFDLDPEEALEDVGEEIV